MKIAIPTNEKNIEDLLCPSFGRAPYFLIYDTKTRKSNFLNNTEILITPRCGEQASDVIKEARIKVYKSLDKSIISNIKAFQKGELVELENFHAGFHGHGG